MVHYLSTASMVKSPNRKIQMVLILLVSEWQFASEHDGLSSSHFNQIFWAVSCLILKKKRSIQDLVTRGIKFGKPGMRSKGLWVHSLVFC